VTPLADGDHLHGADTWASVLAPVPILAVLGAGYAYAALLAGQAPGTGPGGRTPTGRVVAWYAGLGVVAVALFSPLDGSHAVSAHMVQHELLLTIAPILLVAGLDERITLPLHRTVVAPALRTAPGRRVLALLGSPAFATALWVAAVLGGHLPAVYDTILDDSRLHLARQAGLIAVGVVFWLVVVGRRPSVRLQQRIAALGAAMAASGVLAAVLIWSNTVVYPRHAGGGWFGPLGDQRLAGAAMMALDMPVLLGAVGWVVARWARQSPTPDAGQRSRASISAMWSSAHARSAARGASSDRPSGVSR
jgi:putative membrane protein